MPLSPGTKFGLALAGGAAAILGLGVGLALAFRKTTPPTCAQGQFRCASGVCCPNGDYCANTDGSCPSGSSADPNYPGCCVSACPPSCVQDSDCTPCGSNFVCENDACTKQIPAILESSELAAEIPMLAKYVCTGVNFLIGCTDKKCQGSFNPKGSTSLTVSVLDASGRGVPGVDVAITPQLANGAFSWQAVVTRFGTPKTYTTSPVPTGDDGTILVVLTGTVFPPAYATEQNSNYPCNGCDTGNSGSNEGQISVAMGSLTLNVPAYATLGPIPVTVLSLITYNGPDKGCLAGGCSCT